MFMLPAKENRRKCKNINKEMERKITGFLPPGWATHSSLAPKSRSQKGEVLVP